MALHAHHAPPQTTNQTLQVQIRGDQSLSKLPRTYTRLQKDLPVCQHDSHTPTRRHSVTRASTREDLPRAGSASHGLTTLLAREIHVPYHSLARETSRPHALTGAFDARSHSAPDFGAYTTRTRRSSIPRAYCSVICTRPCSRQTLAHARHAPGVPPNLHLPHVSQSAAMPTLASTTGQAKKERIRIH
jgi:hypothetical protein